MDSRELTTRKILTMIDPVRSIDQKSIPDDVIANPNNLINYPTFDWHNCVIHYTFDLEMWISKRDKPIMLDGIIFKNSETPEELWPSFKNSFLKNSHQKLGKGHVSFHGVSLVKAKFEKTLCKQRFSDSDLTRASFEGSILACTYFYRCQLQYANFAYCHAVNTFNEPGNQLCFLETDMSHANLSNSNFDESCRDFDTPFIHTILNNANLHKGSFFNVAFTGCQMKNAILTEGNFEKAKFHYRSECISTDLSGSNATQSSFINASFKSAILKNVNFTEAKLTGANLTDANLTDANFTGARMNGAILRNATFQLAQFSREQMRSFHYDHPHALDYIDTIFKYLDSKSASKQEEVDCANQLIISFIHHDAKISIQNTLFETFLKTGKFNNDPAEEIPSSKLKNNSLHSQLLEIQKQLNITHPATMKTKRNSMR